MREQTRKFILEAVGMLENIYLDNPDEDSITMEYAVKYCYDYFNEFQQDYLIPKTQVRFDGKQNIINEIKKLILNSYIKIYEDKK